MKTTILLVIVLALLLGCISNPSASTDSYEKRAKNIPTTQPPAVKTTPEPPAVNQELFDDAPRDITLNYFLNGVRSSTSLKVYGGFEDYLSTIPEKILYYPDKEDPPTDLDFVLLKLDNPYQKEQLAPLVDLIQQTGKTDHEKVLMATTLVQSIPYDYEAAALESSDPKYPYESLSKFKGICTDKSFLLVYLLRELGYGTALLRFDLEKHAAAGIKCSEEYDFKDSGYCFVESTAPVIPTFYKGAIGTFDELRSDPVVVVISQGKEYAEAKDDFEAATRYEALKNNHKTPAAYQEWLTLRKTYGLERTACDEGKTLCNGECFKPCENGGEFVCTPNGGMCKN